jgi:putative ABC transport system permease protein
MFLNDRSFSWFGDARRDMMHATRLLRRNPVVTMVATVSLAIGIGANTTVFTVANALLFQPPAGVVEPQHLVDIGSTRNGAGFGPSSYLNYVDIRQRATTVEVYAYSRFPQAMSVSGAGLTAESIFGSVVTVNYFSVLGAVPAVGRLFGPEDSDQAGASPVVVLSHRFWTRRFNNDPTIVGRALSLNGRPVTVVGVASEAFNGTGFRALDVWVPMGMVENTLGGSTLTDRAARRLLIGGRLKAGVSTAQAAAEIDVIARALELQYTDNRQTGLRLLPSSPVPGNAGPVVAFVALLTVIVSLVLIVACANVAGVLLARATARRQEMALRLAIGAGRARLLRQLLAESMLLFMLGGTMGLLLARALTSVLVSRLPTLPFPVALSLALDGRVIAFTVGLSLVAALLSGLAPALQASKTDVLSGLRNQAGLVGRLRLRHAFVVVQVAFSIVLIVAAGLFARALYRAGSIDPGFDSHGVELLSVDLALAGYTNNTGSRFARELLDRVRLLPGAQAATIAISLPGGFEVMRQVVAVPGASSQTGHAFVNVDWNVVEPDFFATLRTPITRGRDFSSADRDGSQAVAIVSEAAARQFWPGQDAVGKYLSQPTWGPQGPTNPTRNLLIVGVARDIQSSSVIDGVAGAYVYVPLQQQYVPNLTLAVRTTRGQRIADELRATLASMNPNLPVLTVQTLDDSVALGLAPQRVAASVAGSLGMVGLVLAALGIYGVMAYAVTRRTREIGIRVALGARRADIVGMVLREALWLTAIGSAIGLAIAAIISRVLAAFLFGVPPSDPITFGGVTILFAAIALAACYWPVRRATRIDPTEALRYE